MEEGTIRRRASLALTLTLLAAGCGPGHRLADFDFSGRTVAVEADVPPYPDVLTGPLFLPSGSALEMVLEAGARAAREIQRGSLEAKLDSATARVDLHGLLRQEAGERAARSLGARLVGSDADFLLEVNVLEYGISASDWDATAYFFFDVEAVLYDIGTGAEVWHVSVDAQDPLGPEIFAGPGGARQVVTAAVLARLSVEELSRALEQLADFTARVVTDRLREDLRDVRRGS